MKQIMNFKRAKNFDTFNEKNLLNDWIDNIQFKAFGINHSFFKRIFDIFFSLFIILFVFSWLFPIIALIIKLSSRGPILFIQDRVGLNGKLFRCYKFRTMKVANVKYMYTPTTSRDTRVTLFGKFLRKTNLDELPQFFNVLKGEMSLVGPRPHPIAFHKTYASFIENIDARLLVKPGITGMAQIRGYRGDVEDFEENKFRTKKRIAFDILYIKLWSFKTDMWIVYTTVVQMLGRKTNGH
ncbi:MAG: sugar transferase [Bacteroidetes bacterium]|nr:sugar transferase [Bacteroidota bacterium]MBS1649829.1 sugar transferase [Bacteroidota bacterium]